MGIRPDTAETRQGEAVVHGWCPSAWRPMAAGDGLLVRVRPVLARMSRAQALGLCAAASAFGNGAIDLTNRAALQIRGVTEAGLAGLLERLVSLGLVAADPAVEGRPAILVAPDWTPGDGTEEIADRLADRLGELPVLPGKVGFAVDVAGAPVLGAVPADFRVERVVDGSFLVRADGRETGVVVEGHAVVDTLLALAHWFDRSGGSEAGRMARHRAPLPPSLTGDARPAPSRMPTGTHGAPFGRMDAGNFAELLRATGAKAIRITPWRRIILEGGEGGAVDGFVAPDDTSLRVDACVGAPACPQATVETRALAIELAPHVVGSLHVSGCGKGCARPAAADVVLTGRGGAFDLAFDARAGEEPSRSGLSRAQVLPCLGAH